MNKEIIERFKAYCIELDLGDVSMLNEFYADEIIFKDPIHAINGIDNLREYFKKLNDNLNAGSFQFMDESVVDNKVYLSWELNLQLKRPKKNVKASGMSVLVIDDKIVSHRDYFDAGELFYENIPVLGSIIRSLKKKIAK